MLRFKKKQRPEWQEQDVRVFDLRLAQKIFSVNEAKAGPVTGNKTCETAADLG